MIKVIASLRGRAVKQIIIQDPNEIPDTCVLKALQEATTVLLEGGVAYDSLTASFTRMSVNLELLESLYAAPDDLGLGHQEERFNRRAYELRG